MVNVGKYTLHGWYGLLPTDKRGIYKSIWIFNITHLLTILNQVPGIHLPETHIPLKNQWLEVGR